MPEEHQPTSPERQYFLDWLRVLGTIAVLVFHVSKYFDSGGWIVKNQLRSPATDIVIFTMVLWIMPLFFIVSAMSSVIMLRQRTGARYLRDRSLRLLVPLVFAIFVVICPIQSWVWNAYHAGFPGGFWSFYPHYFDGWVHFGGSFAWMGHHLWYLEELFLLSLLTLPLIQGLLRAPAALSKLAAIAARPGAILLLALPVFGVEMVANQYDWFGSGPNNGGWSLFSYPVFFLIGVLLATDPGYIAACERHRFFALSLLVAVGVALGLRPNLLETYTVALLLKAISSWAFLIVILGFARRYLNRPAGFLSYGNRAVLPFYVLHQTVIVLIGYLILDWNPSLGVKFLALLLSSFATIMVIYHIGIRPFRTTQFLFGMKPAQRIRIPPFPL